MRDDLRVGVFDGGEHALRHGGAVEVEIRMDRADHYVKLRENFFGVVERSVLEDVHFRPCQDADAQLFVVGGVNFLDVCGHALFVQAVGHRDGFRMVGDGNVLVAEFARGFRHFFNRVLSIARRAVHLEVALHVFQGDQMRQFVIFGGGDFAGVFAQLGRDEVQLEFRVDLFFRASGHALFALQGCQRIFIEGETHVVGAAAEGHVVLF